MMIPKKIHYCWFGSNKIPDKTLDYIKSWKSKCPDYEFILWNEDNFDINMNAFVREAYDAKKWAFVSDVARLYALKQQGGIYLDTDIELVDNFDNFLDSKAFIGTERLKKLGDAQLSTAVIGSCKQGVWVTQMLQSYQNRSFRLKDGSLDLTPNTASLTYATFNASIIPDLNQSSDELSVYSSEYFSPKDFFSSKLSVTSNTVAIHHFEGGWVSRRVKIKIAIRRFLVRIFK